jgi:hypothetical protein
VWLIGSLSAASVRDVRADGAACSNRDALTTLLRRHHDFSAKVDVQQCTSACAATTTRSISPLLSNHNTVQRVAKTRASDLGSGNAISTKK